MSLIKINNVYIEVEEVVSEPWAYILYFDAQAGVYYLELFKNYSSATWSEMYRLSSEDGTQFRDDPNWEGANRLATQSPKVS